MKTITCPSGEVALPRRGEKFTIWSAQATTLSIKNMKQRLQNHINSINNLGLRIACDTILDTPEFFTCPASLSFHHAYEGGLSAHTVEVCDAVKHISGYHCDKDYFFFLGSDVNHDILLTAALWHDYAKIKEYVELYLIRDETTKYPQKLFVDASRCYSHHPDYYKRIHHIQGSAIEFTVSAREQGVDESVIEQVQHCILAHHGRKEWGSPVEPQTLEALILHQADMLSAHYGKTK